MSIDNSLSAAVPGGWRLEHSYAELPAVLHEAVGPTAVKEPRLVILNKALAAELGLNAEALSGREGTEMFAGNRLPPGAKPIAQAYAGHQYGHFTVLGDGRAILLGEQVTPSGGRFDVQLKGPGPTPFSRRGDGRAALGPMLREYIISEAMHALGIRTTRSLAVAATGETVWRQSALPGAVLTRVAASHIRVGTFQWVAAKRDEAALRALTDYTLRRHFPERAGAENAALALLTGVVERQAVLMAQWMLVGFVHGVMNTDNMALSGETIDYGPCAFMDTYDLATVFSSIDRHGRYAYGNQPEIAQWNLTRLAEALLPMLHKTEADAIELAKGALQEFGPQFHQHLLAGWRRKLGLFNTELEDVALIEELLEWMQTTKADFTNTFAALAVDRDAAGAGGKSKGRRANDDDANAGVGGASNARNAVDATDSKAGGGARTGVGEEKPIVIDATFTEWRGRWLERLERQPESLAESAALRKASTPAVIPRNHVVEMALASAEQGNLAPMNRLLGVLANPFEHGKIPMEFVQPAKTSEEDEPYQTFCGT